MKTIKILLAMQLGLLAAHAAPGATDGDTLKLATFNIRYGTASDGPNHWTNRRELVINHLKTIDADFAGLQEALVFQIEQIAAGLPGYAWLGVGRDDGAKGGEHSPIFYKKAIYRPDPREQGTFWLSDTPEIPGSITWGNANIRICTWARFIDTRTGRGLYAFNTHLDHVSQPSRLKAIDLILNRIAGRACQDEPYCLTGDFNSGEENEVIARTVRGNDKVRLTDSFRAVNQNPASIATFNSFSPSNTHLNNGKIDYIFVSDRLNTVESAILQEKPQGRYISDHYAVTARVTVLPPARPIGPPGIHSHNDYYRARPLHDALACGAASIEADIFLKDGTLLVAHSELELKPDRTLQALYLEPLAQWIKDGAGRIYRDFDKPLLFHIDLKTEGDTITVLHQALARHPELFERYTRDGAIVPGPVRVLIWDRYRKLLGDPEVRLVNFIAGMDRLEDTAGPADMDGHHARWDGIFQWNGDGPMPADEQKKLAGLVRAAHERGRTVRFWAIPGRVEVYRELALAGVDFINADDLAFAYDFIVSQWPRLQSTQP